MSTIGECSTTITLTPRESLPPDTQGGLIKAIDQGVGKTLNNYTSLLRKPPTSKKAPGFGSEHALSTVAIPNEAGLPVTDWYMRTAVGMVHISMYMRGYAIIWYANFFNTGLGFRIYVTPLVPAFLSLSLEPRPEPRPILPFGRPMRLVEDTDSASDSGVPAASWSKLVKRVRAL